MGGTTNEIHSKRYLDPELVKGYFSKFTEKCVGHGTLTELLAFVYDVDILVSTKEHKARAIVGALDYHQVNRRITRLGIGHIDEPNGDKHLQTLIRGKSDKSVDQFFQDYPCIINGLCYFKNFQLNLLIQDVRPASGSPWHDLTPMTNPTDDIGEKTLGKYIKKSFFKGTSKTTVRLQNGLDRPTLFASTSGAIEHVYNTSPVVASTYVTYGRNPLADNEAIDGFLQMCKKVPRNERLERSLKAAGGILNEVLILYALVNNIGIEASIIPGIEERIENLPLREIYSSLFAPALLAEIEHHNPIVENGGKGEEWLRQVAALALTVRDFANGGSYDAVKALYGQVESGPSPCRDVNSVIKLEPTRHIEL